MKQMGKVGIVILNYNTYDLTCKLVKSSMGMRVFDYIVLVDNCSDDNFEEFLKDFPNDVIYIKTSENGGYAKGNNVGIRILEKKGCSIGFIANPDVIFDKDCIEKISTFLKENKDYAVASCSRNQENGKITGQYWWIPDYKYTVLEALYFGRRYLDKKCIHLTNKETDSCSGEQQNFKCVEVVGGAFFGFNVKLLGKVGYLDENTFLWYEENILAYKLREAGYKVGYLKNCHYVHNHVKKGHGNKNMDIFLASKRYYCYEYLKINKFQKSILAIADAIGLIEEKIICKMFK